MDKYTSYVCPRCGDSTPQRCKQRGCSNGDKVIREAEEHDWQDSHVHTACSRCRRGFPYNGPCIPEIERSEGDEAR